MRQDLFDDLVESVKEMNAIQAGRQMPSRVVRADELLSAVSPDVAALRARLRLSTED